MVNYDKFCKRCEYYEFTFQQGILCGLTHQKPDFDNICNKFILDKARDEKLQKNGATSYAMEEPVNLDEKTEKNVKNIAIGSLVYAAVLSAIGIFELVKTESLFFLIYLMICAVIIIAGSLLVLKENYKKASLCYVIGGILTLPLGIIILVLNGIMSSQIKKSRKSKS